LVKKQVTDLFTKRTFSEKVEEKANLSVVGERGGGGGGVKGEGMREGEGEGKDREDVGSEILEPVRMGNVKPRSC